MKKRQEVREILKFYHSSPITSVIFSAVNVSVGNRLSLFVMGIRIGCECYLLFNTNGLSQIRPAIAGTPHLFEACCRVSS
jgi:hypothetical protein